MVLAGMNRNWTEQYKLDSVYCMRRLKESGNKWTPIGWMNQSQIRFLLEKSIIKRTENELFYVWHSHSGFTRWRAIERKAYNHFIANHPERKQNHFVDAGDIILMSITMQFTCAPKVLRPLRAWYNEVDNMPAPKPEELEYYKIFEDMNSICEDIAADVDGVFEPGQGHLFSS